MDIATSLLSQLSRLSSASASASSTSTSPSKPNRLPPEAKNILLTLHLLFPNELLLALDLLDRALVSPIYRMKDDDDDALMFLVQSSRAAGSAYHVHLHAWNCTCPGFVADMFDATTDVDDIDIDDNNDNSRGNTSFGGLCYDRSTPTPICKHLLACVLLAKCPSLFAREGSRLIADDDLHELAGWCAG